jgi:hypothetical protein
MAKPKPGEINVQDAIEVFVDYRKGLRNKKTATAELVKKTGLEPHIAEVFLRAMKRDNVTQIRGYNNTPEQLKRGRERAGLFTKT